MARLFTPRRLIMAILCLVFGTIILIYFRKNTNNIEKVESFTVMKTSSQNLFSILGKPRVMNDVGIPINVENITAAIGSYDTKDSENEVLAKETGIDEGHFAANVSSNVDRQLLLYNRVPKCGSRSVLWILKTNAKVYNFKYVHSMEFFKFRMKEPDQKTTVNNISQLSRPAAFDMHVHWLNFTKFGKLKPLYMNIIRDPLERHISSYYFNRFGDSVNKFMVSRFKGTDEERQQTYDECVLLNKTECQLDKAFYIVPFFCGQDTRCREPTKWSRDKAIRNALNEYAFIGILEDFETSMKLLERILPQYFKDAPKYLEYINSQGRRRGMHALKKSEAPPSPEVVKIMKKRLAIEYEFYDVIKKRFDDLKQKYGFS